MPRDLMDFARSMSRPEPGAILADIKRKEQGAAALHGARSAGALPWRSESQRAQRREEKRKARLSKAGIAGRGCERCGDPLTASRGRLCSLCGLPVTKIRVADCEVCRRPFIAHGARRAAAACSKECRRKWQITRARTKALHRAHLKRTATASDITAQQEAEMRRRVRKCPLCGVWMTGKGRLPNSKELDHILPVNQGGTHTHGNVRIICRTCNLKRPKDGNDYLGTLTLWAQAPGVVSRPPKPKKPTRSARTCGCGVSIRRGGSFMCPDCTDDAACRAAELHASGMTWAQVAPIVGYTTAEGVRYAAKRTGYTPEPRQRKPPPEPARCACGGVRRRGSRYCAPCIKGRAERAAHLHYDLGWSYWSIAKDLSLNSLTSVTNLLKMDPRYEAVMGRPVSR